MMNEIDELNKRVVDKIGKPTRIMAPFRWFGGKGHMAKKIIPHIPSGKVYVEPFAGAASLFWHRKPHGVEVLNDLHEEIITLYRVLQDRERFDELYHRLIWTPYSLSEFKKARRNQDQSDVARAWAFFVRQNMGFSGKCECDGDWGRAFTECRGMAATASILRGRIKMLEWWHDRLSRVQLDNRCAIEVIQYWDSKDTVFYIDPPYVASTRKSGSYEHECSDDFHSQLVELLLSLKGKFVLSGYDADVYKPLEPVCNRVEFKTVCHAAAKTRGTGLQGKGSALKNQSRTEVLWIKGSNKKSEIGGLFE